MTGEPAYATHDYRAQQAHREHARDTAAQLRIASGAGRGGRFDRLTADEFEAALAADLERARHLAASGYGDAAYEECPTCARSYSQSQGGHYGLPCTDRFGNRLPVPHDSRVRIRRAA
jgi:hypothetical protein